MKDEILLPEGYDPGKDFFAEAKAEEPAVQPQDETHAEQTEASAEQSRPAAAGEPPAAPEDRQSRIRRQNETAAVRAPVRGVTGGGAAEVSAGKSPFELGFENPWN